METSEVFGATTDGADLGGLARQAIITSLLFASIIDPCSSDDGDLRGLSTTDGADLGGLARQAIITSLLFASIIDPCSSDDGDLRGLPCDDEPLSMRGSLGGRPRRSCSAGDHHQPAVRIDYRSMLVG
jgi:hypothetical protein